MIHPRHSAQADVEPSVRQSRLLLDEPRARHREDFGASVKSPLPARLQERHGDQPVPPEDVLRHLPVARLEDVQRQGGVREEDEIRQREDRDCPPRPQGLERPYIAKPRRPFSRAFG